MICRRFCTTGLLAVALAAAASRGGAEVIVLKSGGQLQGRPVRVGDMLRIEIRPGTAVTVPVADVLEIRPGTWRDEYLRRRTALPADGIAARYRLAVWCRERGLAKEHEAGLREVLRRDPDHAGARARLAILTATRRKSPAPAPAAEGPWTASARREAGHVVAFTDGNRRCAEVAAREAEDAIADFAALLGIEETDARLAGFRVFVRHYTDRTRYREAARREGVTGNGGYYSPMTLTCHVMGHSADSLPVMDLRTVRHEVTHAFLWSVAGIAARDAWLHESLATTMEARGDSTVPLNRLWVLAANSERTELSLTALFNSEFRSGRLGRRLLDYSRAWSFGHFMLHGDDERAGRFRKFLADCRGWKIDLRAAFRKHFPDAHGVESAWRDHVNGLIREHLPKNRGSLFKAPGLTVDELQERIFAPRRSRRPAAPERTGP
jgi:hypothetical protein